MFVSGICIDKDCKSLVTLRKLNEITFSMSIHVHEENLISFRLQKSFFPI